MNYYIGTTHWLFNTMGRNRPMTVSEFLIRKIPQVCRVRRQTYIQRVRNQNGLGLIKTKLAARIPT